MANRILDKVRLPASYPTKSDIITRHGASYYYSRNDPAAGDMIGVPIGGTKRVGWYQYDENTGGYTQRGTSAIMPQAQVWPAAKAFADDAGMGNVGGMGDLGQGIAEWGTQQKMPNDQGEPPIVAMPGHKWQAVGRGLLNTTWEIVTIDGVRKEEVVGKSGKFPWALAVGALLVGAALYTSSRTS